MKKVVPIWDAPNCKQYYIYKYFNASFSFEIIQSHIRKTPKSIVCEVKDSNKTYRLQSFFCDNIYYYICSKTKYILSYTCGFIKFVSLCISLMLCMYCFILRKSIVLNWDTSSNNENCIFAFKYISFKCDTSELQSKL